jgi:hypothetical protein
MSTLNALNASALDVIPKDLTKTTDASLLEAKVNNIYK